MTSNSVLKFDWPYVCNIINFVISRDEIAGCSEKAYDTLSVADARQMLLFSTDRELSEYINEVFFLFLNCLPLCCGCCQNRLRHRTTIAS